VIEFKEIESLKKRRDINKEYIKTIGVPIDGFWENVVIGTSKCYQIIHDKKLVGHFFVDANKTLVQFHVIKEYYTSRTEIFEYIIKSKKVRSADVSTKELEYLALCLDNQKSVEVHTYLFDDNQKITQELNGFSKSTFRLANKDDIDTIKINCDVAYDGYYEDLIENDNLFVLYNESCLLGIGEFRVITSNEQYGDIGVVVAEEYRRRGIGTFIINQLKEHCYNKELQPLACCEVENIASRNTMEKAGFITKHCILHINFK